MKLTLAFSFFVVCTVWAFPTGEDDQPTMEIQEDTILKRATRSSCPTTLQRNMGSGRLCFQAWDSSGCKGRTCYFPPGTFGSVRNLPGSCSNNFWHKHMEQVAVGAGCSLKLCRSQNLRGTCDTYSATSSSSKIFKPPSNKKIESVSCTC